MNNKNYLLLALFGISMWVSGSLLGGAIGHHYGNESGRQEAEEIQRRHKDYNDTMMRKIGICSWAKVMAARIECKNEFKPGEP